MISRRLFLSLSSGVSALLLRIGAVEAGDAGNKNLENNTSGSKSNLSAVPYGFRRPSEFRWGWGPNDEGVIPNWIGGDGTKFDPNLIKWNADGSVLLALDYLNGEWVGGELQIIKPRRSISEKWGAVVSSDNASAVCAIFAYAEDGTEIDFEWRGDQVWQLNLHLFDAKNNRVNPSNLPTVNLDISKPHIYEFSMDTEACIWFVDSKEVARITPKDMPDAIWKANAKLAMFVSIEHHGAWAKHNYANLPATMRVHGILV